MAEEAKQRGEIAAWPVADRNAPLSVPAVQAPTTATAFAAKATDLEALRNAVVEAAGVKAGLWLSYLFLLFYLAIAAGSVTHRDLFFETPVKLPFLNVELPLVVYFVLGPLLFLIVHAYVLMHFVLLAGKVGAFHAELQQITDDHVRACLRRQLPSDIFVQFLAGPREVRTGMRGIMLRLFAWIPLVVGPLALLVFFQLQFLPYHSEWITWWHRLAVVADLALLWALWPSVARGQTKWAWRDLRRSNVLAAGLMSLAPVLLVFTIVTFPGEWLNEHLPVVRFVPSQWPHAAETQWSHAAERGDGAPLVKLWRSTKPTSLHKLLLEGEFHFVGQKSTLWSDVLVLPRLDAINHAKFDTDAKIAAVPATLSLRGRRLEGAVLNGADLRKVDFTGAKLEDAHLPGASLSGARLTDAQLQGADLKRAKLQGADLKSAWLQGADLAWAKLQGADLRSAWLQGASLTEAELQGASLSWAKLQGANIAIAQLQGADLAWAELQGAWLSFAQLQGAHLGGAHLQNASLSGVFVWRADARHVDAEDREGAFIFEPKTSPMVAINLYHGLSPINDKSATGAKFPHFVRVSNWTADSFAKLKRLIVENVPGDQRVQALQRIAELDPTGGLEANEESERANAWKDFAKKVPSIEDYDKGRAASLRDTGCYADHYARYVIRSFVLNHVVEGMPTLAAAFLDEQHCPGARGLSDDVKTKLREIRNRAASSSPNSAGDPRP